MSVGMYSERNVKFINTFCNKLDVCVMVSPSATTSVAAYACRRRRDHRTPPSALRGQQSATFERLAAHLTGDSAAGRPGRSVSCSSLCNRPARRAPLADRNHLRERERWRGGPRLLCKPRALTQPRETWSPHWLLSGRSVAAVRCCVASRRRTDRARDPSLCASDWRVLW